MHKVFISHHHRNDQRYKDQLVDFGERYSIFVDRSVDTGDIPDDWADETIRREIRDSYLRDSTVTVVLVGMRIADHGHPDAEHRQRRRCCHYLRHHPTPIAVGCLPHHTKFDDDGVGEVVVFVDQAQTAPLQPLSLRMPSRAAQTSPKR